MQYLSRGLSLVVVVVMLWLSACATTIHQPYVRPASLPEGKAMVYIYRPGVIAMVFDLKLKANGKPLQAVPSGSYYPYLADLGVIEFTGTIGGRSVKPMYINARQGKVYFLTIQGLLSQGNDALLVQVPDAEAEAELTTYQYKRVLESEP